MRLDNLNSLERLSLFCHFGGLFSVFAGIAVALMNLLDGDFRNMQNGVFIFITGYALFKIGARLTQIVETEKTS